MSTLNGTVHLNDYDDYDRYINDKNHSDHERHHLRQVEEDYYGSSTIFLLDTVLQYIDHLSHDDAPNEIDADNHGGKPYRDPNSGSMWYEKVWDYIVFVWA